MATEQEVSDSERGKAWEAAYPRTFLGQCAQLRAAVLEFRAVLWQAAQRDWQGVKRLLGKGDGDGE